MWVAWVIRVCFIFLRHLSVVPVSVSTCVCLLVISNYLSYLLKMLSLPKESHLTNSIHSPQIKMFANQLTMAVNIFVLILMIPISVSATRTSYWRKMGKLVKVSCLIFIMYFLIHSWSISCSVFFVSLTCN